MAMRAGRQAMQPLPRVASPLATDAAFAREIRDDYAPRDQNVAERALIGGVLAFAVVRAAQNRGGRR